MASELRKLTKLGADTRKIAALLQSKGRGRDTVLAHITPEEADLLKARGGRGSINPETGLPEFENEMEAGVGDALPAEFITSPSQVAERLKAEGEQIPDLAVPQQQIPQLEPLAPPEVQTQGFLQQMAGKTGMSEDFLKRLGLAGLQAIPGVVQGRRAAQQAGTYKGEQQALAAPYQQLGRQLQAQAQAGQLTPQAQRAMQAARAQLAQGAEARGGVGAQQAATQLESFRQQLLQQQFDYGLKLSGIGDNIALGAIRTGMQADQYVNNLTSQFYNNLFRTVTGQPLAAPAPAPAPAGG